MQKLAKILLTTLLTTAVSVAVAAPVGYSINSDSTGDRADSLFRIDLATGEETWVGSVSSFGQSRIDVEGLAFAPDGTLYGVDESSYITLFPINTDNGQVLSQDEVFIDSDHLATLGNDFGMTFTCDGNLYITSVAKQSLLRLDLGGETTVIGTEGNLGFNISSLAAYGEDPVKLYGLGNGLDADLKEDTRTLYSISVTTGKATALFSLGNEAGAYAESGLAFDDDGQLWAITDRRDKFGAVLPSQVMKLDLDQKKAVEIKDTGESGFESLAITVPRGCATSGGDNAQFKVQKQFVDDNDSLPTTLNIRCDSGLPLEQSITTETGDGVEVTFTVTDFQDGELNCDIWETTPDGYQASYECFSTGDCIASATQCKFSKTAAGQDNLCVIRNYPESVQVEVSSVWVDDQQLMVEGTAAAAVELICRHVLGGDGEWSVGEMSWTWLVYPDSPSQYATVEPLLNGKSECRIETTPMHSAIESTSSCDDWSPVFTDAGTLSCTVTHTLFFEGIPTLGRGGLLLTVVLVLFTGLVFVRRF